MNKGELEFAVRRAHNLLDEWIDVTEVVRRYSSYYYELQGIVEDAVHCGVQQALGVHEPLDSEKDG